MFFILLDFAIITLKFELCETSLGKMKKQTIKKTTGLLLIIIFTLTPSFIKTKVDYNITQKSFNFPKKHGLPFYFVSASDGTNVVKVSKYNLNNKIKKNISLFQV